MDIADKQTTKTSHSNLLKIPKVSIKQQALSMQFSNNEQIFQTPLWHTTPKQTTPRRISQVSTSQTDIVHRINHPNQYSSQINASL